MDKLWQPCPAHSSPSFSACPEFTAPGNAAFKSKPTSTSLSTCTSKGPSNKSKMQWLTQMPLNSRKELWTSFCLSSAFCLTSSLTSETTVRKPILILILSLSLPPLVGADTCAAQLQVLTKCDFYQNAVAAAILAGLLSNQTRGGVCEEKYFAPGALPSIC